MAVEEDEVEEDESAEKKKNGRICRKEKEKEKKTVIVQWVNKIFEQFLI